MPEHPFLLEIAVLLGESGWRIALPVAYATEEADFSLSGAALDEAMAGRLSRLNCVESADYHPNIRTVNIRLTEAALFADFPLPHTATGEKGELDDFTLQYADFLAERYANTPSSTPDRKLAAALLLGKVDLVAARLYAWHEALLRVQALAVQKAAQKKDGFFIEKDAIQAPATCAILAQRAAVFLRQAVLARRLTPLAEWRFELKDRS